MSNILRFLKAPVSIISAVSSSCSHALTQVAGLIWTSKCSNKRRSGQEGQRKQESGKSKRGGDRIWEEGGITWVKGRN